MRSLIDVGTKEIVNIDNLSPEYKYAMGQMLNTIEMLHIETLYYTADGKHYYKAHEYKGNDKQYKGKKYARFKYENIDIKDNNNNIKRTRKSVPMPEFEIVQEIEAQYFIDEYIQMLKDGTFNTPVKDKAEDPKVVEGALEEYLKNLVNKIIKNK